MKKTILLVEDSRVQKLASEKMLLRAGYLVLWANDGEEGLRLARESIPDLVLLDLLLPGIGGEQVLRTLKLDERIRQIPVIIVSHVSANASTQLTAAGAADYFEKSRFLDDQEGEVAFLRMIERVLRESQGQNDPQKKISLVARRQGASG
jgi:twitching motility two-component system response regulator PilH